MVIPALAADGAVAPSPVADETVRPAPRRWWSSALAIWALIWTAFFISASELVRQMEFRDPDDELRLQQVRDLLAGQGWFDLHAYRVDAASGGVVMHWSRLVDAPLAAVIALLRPFLGTAGAEQAAAVIVPALTLLTVVLLVGWMAARTLPTQTGRILAMACIAFAAPVMMQVLPLRIDHHGWQIALALTAVATCLSASQRVGGWISGAALAAWMAISFEGLPFSAWFIAVLGMVALRSPAQCTRLVATMQSLAIASIALFMATRGFGDLAQHCDAIAPIHLAIFTWGAVAITVPAMAWPQSRLALMAGFAVAGAGAIALVTGSAPQCLTGNFDMIDPVVRTFWYDKVAEGKPLLGAPLAVIVQYVVPPLLGLAAATRLAVRSSGAMRRWWTSYALLLGGALAIALAVTRAASIAGVLAVLPLGWLIASILANLKRPPNALLRVGELVGTALLIFCMLVPAIPVVAVVEQFEPQAAEKPEGEPKIACTARKARAALAALPAGGILAPLDFGPNIIANSHLSVLATGHHRGAKAMRDVIDAFRGTPDDALRIMRKHRLRYVMICPDVQELGLYRDANPRGFAAQLMDGKSAAWMTPIPLPADSGLKMWALAE